MLGILPLTRVALLVAALAALGLELARRRRRARASSLDELLAVLAVLGALSFVNYGRFHGPGFGLIHPSEMYTYYLSSKYFRELGYDGLYRATLRVDAEHGETRLGPLMWARDLTTGEVVDIEELRREAAGGASVRARFTRARWRAFAHDVDYFLSLGTLDHWRRALLDHGYNAPPPRTLLGAALAGVVGPATAVSIHAIAFVDVLLLAAMLVGVHRVFGFRVAALVAVLFGANSLAAYTWIGGSLLRQDWLAASVLGVCALRAGRPVAAGALIGAAALVRVFPALFAAMVLFRAVALFVRERRWEREATRFAIGLGLAALVLGAPSLLVPGGVVAWQEFAARIAAHVARTSANYIGLPALLPDAPWLLRTAQAGVVAACAWAAARVSSSQAAILGCALVFAFGALSCYYYALLVLPLCWRRLDDIDGPALARIASIFAVPIVSGLLEATSDAPSPTLDPRIFTGSSIALIPAFAVLLLLAARARPQTR